MEYEVKVIGTIDVCTDNGTYDEVERAVADNMGAEWAARTDIVGMRSRIERDYVDDDCDDLEIVRTTVLLSVPIPGSYTGREMDDYDAMRDRAGVDEVIEVIPGDPVDEIDEYERYE